MRPHLILPSLLLVGILAVVGTTARATEDRGAPLPEDTWSLLQARQYAEALPIVSKLASAGNHQAQFILANYYICGRVVEFSCQKAVSLFNEAANPSTNDQSDEIVFRSKNEIAWINSACEESGFVRDTHLALRYASEAAKDGDPYSIDSLAAAQARLGDFKAAIDSQRSAITRLTEYARDNPIEQFTFDEFRSRLELYQANKPARFGKWNAERNCNAFP